MSRSFDPSLKIPPPLQAAVAALLMWLIARGIGNTESYSAWQALLVVIVLATGIGISAFALMIFTKLETTIDPRKPEQAADLVMVGIYRYIRNPMYLGLVLVLVAWNIHLNSLFSFVILPLFVWYITSYQIIPEEQALLEKFGDTYKSYMANTHRWI